MWPYSGFLNFPVCVRKQILSPPLQILGVFEWHSSRIGVFRSTEVTKVCGRKQKSSCESKICVDVHNFLKHQRLNLGKSGESKLKRGRMGFARRLLAISSGGNTLHPRKLRVSPA